ncbi:MAG: AsmA family protein [Planctomycetota bacterium]|jgi:uncharacterized protein involved in outer membrane biogenesis
MRRLIKWLFGLVLLLALFVLFVLPMLANTEAGRNRLASVLSRAFDREVALGGLKIGFLYSSVDVEKLRMANPKGYPQGAMLEAERLELDTGLKDLLGGLVRGSLEGSRLHLHVIRKGGGTNLDGLVRGGSSEEGGDTPDLDLSLELRDSRLTVEDLDKGDKLVLDGVGLTMRLTNRQGVQDAGLQIRVRAIDRGGLHVRELEIDARQAGEFLELDRLRGLLSGEGELSGTGRLRVRNGDEWNVKLDAKNVALEEDMMPIVGALVPFAAKAGGQVTGRLNANFEVRGNGLTWEAMKPTLAGTGRAALTDLALPAEAMLAQIAHLAGREAGGVALNDAGAQFQVSRGWLEFQRLSASGGQARYDLAGRVSLDGQLELTMDIMPLVKQFGGAGAYREAARYVEKIPVRIGGTATKPRLKAPRAEDFAKDALGKGLEDLFKKKK